MNRILFEKSEIRDGLCTFSGPRAEHVLGVLHGEIGQTLKTGELDGPVGTSEIVSMAGGEITVRCSHSAAAPAPWIDLVLAPPRPRVMKRLLPQLAALGVGHIVLVGAEKVEKAFWGAQLLREEVHRPLLVDGLMQSGTSTVPKIQVEKNFRRYAANRLDEDFAASAAKFVAHPYSQLPHTPTHPLTHSPIRLRQGYGGQAHPLTHSRITLAIGPEGGWTDEEVELLESHGFERFSLGPRILRTDTAAVALIAQLMPHFDDAKSATEEG